MASIFCPRDIWGLLLLLIAVYGIGCGCVQQVLDAISDALETY